MLVISDHQGSKLSSPASPLRREPLVTRAQLSPGSEHLCSTRIISASVRKADDSGYRGACWGRQEFPRTFTSETSGPLRTSSVFQNPRALRSWSVNWNATLGDWPLYPRCNDCGQHLIQANRWLQDTRNCHVSIRNGLLSQPTVLTDSRKKLWNVPGWYEGESQFPREGDFGPGWDVLA